MSSNGAWSGSVIGNRTITKGVLIRFYLYRRAAKHAFHFVCRKQIELQTSEFLTTDFIFKKCWHLILQFGVWKWTVNITELNLIHLERCVYSESSIFLDYFQLSRIRTLLGVGLNDGVVGSDSFRRLRVQLDEMEKERDRLAESESKLRAEILRESEARKEIEAIWNEKAEIHKTETEAFSDRIKQLEGLVQVRLKYYVFLLWVESRIVIRQRLFCFSFFPLIGSNLSAAQNSTNIL